MGTAHRIPWPENRSFEVVVETIDAFSSPSRHTRRVTAQIDAKLGACREGRPSP